MARSLVVTALVVVAHVAACSTDAGIDPSGSGGPLDAGEASGDVNAVDAETGAGDGAPPGGAEPLLPLEVGRTWTFDVARIGGSSACAPGQHVETALAIRQVDGRDAVDVRSFCTAAGVNTFARSGERVDLRYQNGWIIVIDPNIVDGHEWTSTGPIRYRWRPASPTTVPAGSFADCWRREQIVTYTAYDVFCRGVGPVHSVSIDLNGNGWDAQLNTFTRP